MSGGEGMKGSGGDHNSSDKKGKRKAAEPDYQYQPLTSVDEDSGQEVEVQATRDWLEDSLPLKRGLTDEEHKRIEAATKGLATLSGIEPEMLGQLSWASQDQVNEALAVTSKLCIAEEARIIFDELKTLVFKDRIPAHVNAEHRAELQKQKNEDSYGARINKSISNDLAVEARVCLGRARTAMVRDQTDLMLLMKNGMCVDHLIVPAAQESACVLRIALAQRDVKVYLCLTPSMTRSDDQSHSLTSMTA